MRIKVGYVVEVDATFRRGINRYYGRPGLATRDQVKSWFQMFGQSMNDDISYQEQQIEEGNESQRA